MQDDTNKMIDVVTHESNIAAEEQEKANAEEAICTGLAVRAAGIQGEANKELEEMRATVAISVKKAFFIKITPLK